MQMVLKNVSDDRLRAYIVWLPMLDSDIRAAAEERSGEFSDERLTYFWDGERLAGKLWQRVLDFPGIAWDVYFLYGPEAKWENDPPVPDFWMLSPIASKGWKAAPLNQPEFEAKARELLGKTE